MMLNKYNVGNTVIDRGQFPLQGLVEPDVAEILGKRKLCLDVVYIIFKYTEQKNSLFCVIQINSRSIINYFVVVTMFIFSLLVCNRIF